MSAPVTTRASRASPVFEIGELDSASRKELMERPGVARIPAKKLYNGKQQLAIDSAVATLRSLDHEVTRYFVSAGFGIIGENELLPPYDATFNDLSSEAQEARANKLGISEDLGEILSSTDADIVFFPLGADYYASFDLSEALQLLADSTNAVVFNQETIANQFENVISISARTEDARDQGVTVIKLKGRYLENFANQIARGQEVDSIDDIKEFCLVQNTTQSGFDDFS
jgi:hypothetical protein